MKQRNAIFAMTLAIALAGVFFFSGKVEAGKHYRSRSNFSVTGDGTNADFAASSAGGGSSQSTLYRKVAFPGLRMSNPFSFRVFKEMDSDWNFGEEAWNAGDHFFITDGNLWFHYGYNSTFGGETTYSEYSTGNHRYFGYYGGTKKKKRKNSAYKTYEFSVSGTENDADTTSNQSGSITTYYYRKVSVPEIQLDNMVDYRLYSRNGASQGYSDESWMIETDDFFFADGALYVAYGYKNSTPGSAFSSFGDNTFRLFTYSDGKRKKGRLKKQYVRRYAFSVPDDAVSADKVAVFTDSEGYVSREYYDKTAVKGVKTADVPNIQVLRKNNFASGFSGESWSQVAYTVTNGYIWIDYGSQSSDPDGTTYDFEAAGAGDYRAFQYR